MILFYSLGIILFFAVIIYYFIWQDDLKDKNNLEKQWNNFLKAELLNDWEGLISNGEKLILNKYLGNEKLNILIKVIKIKISDFPELKDLDEKAFNKKLHYDRILPYPGSSGGIKQSW